MRKTIEIINDERLLDTITGGLDKPAAHGTFVPGGVMCGGGGRAYHHAHPFHDRYQLRTVGGDYMCNGYFAYPGTAVFNQSVIYETVNLNFTK